MNVRRILAPNPGPFTGDGTNTYVLDSDGQAVVIDPGPDDTGHLAAVADAVGSLVVKMILVTHTHEDHAPGANPLSALVGAPTGGFGSGPEFKADRLLADNDIVEFGSDVVHVVATPGHSADHFCYLVGTALFTGDHIMGGSSVFVEDMTAYMASLRKIQQLPLEVLYPGHGPAMHDPHRVVSDYLEHRLERERQILGALASGAATVGAIVDNVYTQVDPELIPLATGAVRAHLHKLEGEGVVRVSGDEVMFP
jgi:glyoxylase-like metal-dependent hydrolase (beta-lactamase superfamily II)